MNFIGQAVGSAWQPLVVSLVSLSMLALLRLLTPDVRWARKLKHEGEIAGALPPGDERDKWERRVVAQAERLRIYRESVRFWDQFWAWGALVIMALLILTALDEAAAGWPALDLMGVPEWLMGAAGMLGCSWLIFHLVAGHSLNLHASDRYPKWLALKNSERASVRRRAEVDGRARVRLGRLRSSKLE